MTFIVSHLIRLSGDDFPQLQDDFISACAEGPKALMTIIKVSIVAYSAALARNAKTLTILWDLLKGIPSLNNQWVPLDD